MATTQWWRVACSRSGLHEIEPDYEEELSEHRQPE